MLTRTPTPSPALWSLALACALLDAQARGATTFVGTISNTYSDPANWDNGLPSPTNAGIISGTFSVTASGTNDLAGDILTLTDSATLSGGAPHLKDSEITLQNGSSMETSGNATLSGSAASLTIEDSASFSSGHDLVISKGATATQSGGSVTIDRTLNLGHDSGNTYDLAGGTLQVQDHIQVSKNNTFLWQSGGTLAVHPAASVIDYRGDLYALAGARLDLNSSTEYLAVSKDLGITSLEIDGYDLMLPAGNPDGLTVTTGSYLLAYATQITGTNVTYTNFTADATLINPGDPFDPLTARVYWFEQTPSTIEVRWSLPPIPEPSAALLLQAAALLLLARRPRPSRDETKIQL